MAKKKEITIFDIVLLILGIGVALFVIFSRGNTADAVTATIYEPFYYADGSIEQSIFTDDPNKVKDFEIQNSTAVATTSSAGTVYYLNDGATSSDDFYFRFTMHIPTNQDGLCFSVYDDLWNQDEALCYARKNAGGDPVYTRPNGTILNSVYTATPVIMEVYINNVTDVITYTNITESWSVSTSTHSAIGDVYAIGFYRPALGATQANFDNFIFDTVEIDVSDISDVNTGIDWFYLGPGGAGCTFTIPTMNTCYLDRTYPCQVEVNYNYACQNGTFILEDWTTGYSVISTQEAATSGSIRLVDNNLDFTVTYDGEGSKQYGVAFDDGSGVSLRRYQFLTWRTGDGESRTFMEECLSGHVTFGTTTFSIFDAGTWGEAFEVGMTKAGVNLICPTEWSVRKFKDAMADWKFQFPINLVYEAYVTINNASSTDPGYVVEFNLDYLGSGFNATVFNSDWFTDTWGTSTLATMRGYMADIINFFGYMTIIFMLLGFSSSRIARSKRKAEKRRIAQKAANKKTK